MQFQHPHHSIEDAVQNELLHQALTLAHHKHAAMHTKDEKFELHVIEDTSRLSHAVEQKKSEQEKTENKESKSEPHHHDANYHPVSDKYDAQFHIDTLKDCMIGCDCGWKAHLSEFLNDDVVSIETKKEKDTYHRSASYSPDPSAY